MLVLEPLLSDAAFTGYNYVRVSIKNSRARRLCSHRVVFPSVREATTTTTATVTTMTRFAEPLNQFHERAVRRMQIASTRGSVNTAVGLV